MVCSLLEAGLSCECCVTSTGGTVCTGALKGTRCAGGESTKGDSGGAGGRGGVYLSIARRWRGAGFRESLSWTAAAKSDCSCSSRWRFKMAALQACLALFEVRELIEFQSSSEKTGCSTSGGWTAHSLARGCCIAMLRGDKAYLILCLVCLRFLLILEPLEVRPSTCAGYMLAEWLRSCAFREGRAGSV